LIATQPQPPKKTTAPPKKKHGVRVEAVGGCVIGKKEEELSKISLTLTPIVHCVSVAKNTGERVTGILGFA
jgi:hypothetical protein